MAREDGAERANRAEIVDRVDEEGNLEAVCRHLQEGEVGPRGRLGDMVTPPIHRVGEGPGGTAGGIVHAAQDETFERIESARRVAETRAPGAVGRTAHVLDDRLADLDAIQHGDANQPEKIPDCVGSALPLASAVHHEPATVTHRVGEGLQR